MRTKQEERFNEDSPFYTQNPQIFPLFHKLFPFRPHCHTKKSWPINTTIGERHQKIMAIMISPTLWNQEQHPLVPAPKLTSKSSASSSALSARGRSHGWYQFNHQRKPKGKNVSSSHVWTWGRSTRYISASASLSFGRGHLRQHRFLEPPKSPPPWSVFPDLCFPPPAIHARTKPIHCRKLVRCATQVEATAH